MITDEPLLIGWRSPKYGDIIPHARVICVKAGAIKGSLVVRLEDDNCITVFPDEAESFTESYMTYLHTAQILELQVITEDDPPSNQSLKKRSN
tara:strand:- start:6134 stop:6412 length:279 start_codon:yes stop_codon:yes gene_type:complete